MIKLNLKFFLYHLLFLTLFSSCATQVITPVGMQVMSEREYEHTIEEGTQREQLYSSLQNILEIHATLLNSKVTHAILDQNARLYLWDITKYAEEQKKFKESAQSETIFFVSFYTPERKHDDLSKSKSLWKIFLDVKGRRYEGTATKIKLTTTEIRSIYPFHNRFSTGYFIKFPVPMEANEGHTMKLTLTGAVGSLSLVYSNPTQ